MIVKSLPYYARFECPEGNTTFSLHQIETSPKESNVWIYFEVNNPDEYVKQLISKGIQFEEMPNDKPWLWRESRLKDLDNNQIIIYYAGDNRKNPPWKIKS